MNQDIRMDVENYVSSHIGEAEELLRTLARIPAPSRQEDRRAAFVAEWLRRQGAEHVTVDAMKNVLCEIGTAGQEKLTVFAAHMDTVFPDTEELPLRQEGRILYAPGIGDDTANLVNLLMAAKYLLTNRPRLDTGILIAANTCEEGLGNLDGTKQIFAAYGNRIESFCSFDLYLPQCTGTAVGSHRYKITAKTAGGHSWTDFGRRNAIEVLAEMTEKLYRIPLPEAPAPSPGTQLQTPSCAAPPSPLPVVRTTQNVGYIQGGTTVNAIASEAFMLYEYRSTSQECLEVMHKNMQEVIASCERDCKITAENIGIRPGNGRLDPAALAAFTERNAGIIREITGEEPDSTPISSDSNIPLSLGIPANTIGTIRGGGAHTRDEWIDLDSLPAGMKIVLHLMLRHSQA